MLIVLAGTALAPYTTNGYYWMVSQPEIQITAQNINVSPWNPNIKI